MDLSKILALQLLLLNMEIDSGDLEIPKNKN